MFPDFDELQRKFDEGLKAIVDAINDQIIETSNTNDKLDRIIELLEKEDDLRR